MEQQDVDISRIGNYILRVGNHWIRYSEVIAIEYISYVLSHGKEAQKYEFTMKGTDKVITVSKEEFDIWIQRLRKEGMTKEEGDSL
jgi:hypothetical protein